jgi:hypothetical protein
MTLTVESPTLSGSWLDVDHPVAARESFRGCVEKWDRLARWPSIAIQHVQLGLAREYLSCEVCGGAIHAFLFSLPPLSVRGLV